MLTPPLHQSLSIPFRWEVVPGTARAANTAVASGQPPKNMVARRLDLPPRLLNDDSKIAKMSSPVTVLDGPYIGHSLSLACTFSFREEGARNLGPGRCGSFKEEGKFSLGDAFKIDKRSKRFKRRSFFNLSRMNSNIWVSFFFTSSILCLKRMVI
ncbi:hypothetical protein F511_32569 [Dorcoceras hygrometricum]|uniref:Uncharacterized protein n=1 Tax=Dorcoceras hygrometricum TaxID=472368 RepID=A0A2Z7BCB6_9LAMI|nr:hypothetical protein F511_32569 [Dorcoceras hygrometricum]